MMPVTYKRIQEYLNKVGSGAALAPHGKFWRVTHAEFVVGNMPGLRCAGEEISIIDQAAPASSAFYQILSSAKGFCGFAQMPAFEAKLTESDFKLTLADGTIVTGAQVLADILEWLEAGAPEEPDPVPAA